MPSTMRSVAAVTLALSAFSHLSTASPASSSSGAMSSAGCFNNSTPLTSKGTWKYQSTGYCLQQCSGYSVMALSNGNECFCGNTLPAKSSMQSDDSECNISCVGYPDDTCGGDGYWSVFYTGSNTNVGYYNGGSSASSSKSGSNSATSSTTAAPTSQTTTGSPTSATDKATVITSIAPGKTVVITQLPAAAATTTTPAGDAQKSKKGGSNTAGIAAGVVVAVVVIAALIGAAFFFWRRRQRQQAESGHQQLPDYSNAASRPMTYKPAAGPDSRLDHDAMAQRRMSDGSIADNQDYSRRILKVTNPDDR